jgi:radical SAM protein with 4Fe4S-binding SPASM domain
MDDQRFVLIKSTQKSGLFSGRRPLLSHLDIELTERCNNACMHCYINLPAGDLRAANRELTTDEWKAILQQAADLGALSVRFTGGEPLLREDFLEIYLFTRRLGIKVFLFTNARLITAEIADTFARIPPLKPIEISVYGMQPETYDTVACRPGAYAEFRGGVALLLERKVPFVVKSVLLPPNKGDRDEFERWAATLPGMEKPPAYSVFLDLRARRDLLLKNCTIESLRFSPEEGLSLLSRDTEDYRRSMAPFIAGFMYPQGDELFNCGAGEGGCVDAYGQYQMCMLLRHPELVVDLKDGTLREGLTEAFPLFKQTRATNPEYLRRCARCFLNGLCEQCPGKSWAEHGTLDTPVEYLCQVAHAQARFLGLLREGEVAWEVRDWKERIAAFAASVQADTPEPE